MTYRPNIKQLAKTSWYREGGAMAPFYIHIPYLGQFKSLNYGVFYCKKSIGYGYYDKEIMGIMGRKIFEKQLQNKKFINKLIAKWTISRDQQDNFFNSLNDFDLKDLTNKRLVGLYRNFNKTRENLWGKTAFILEIFNEYDLLFLNELMIDLNQKLSSQEIKILTTLPFLTFSGMAKKDFLNLFQKFKARNKNFDKELDKYVQNYFWLHNNWAFIHYLDRKYFLKQLHSTNYQKLIQEVEKNDKYLTDAKQKQKDITNKRKLHPKLVNYFYFLRQLGSWREERKKQTLKENGWADKFLREFSKRNRIDYSLLKYISPYYFENKIDVPSQLLKNLNTSETLMIGENFKNWKIFYGIKAKKARNRIEETLSSKTKRTLEGRIANSGIVKGIVRIVSTYKDFKKVKKGDILVTSMTRPEFVPILKRIKGIIADEGGITCHAAIISRELNIPCIIGTKIATEVLKDGDLVEMDAERGIVKILKKNKI